MNKAAIIRSRSSSNTAGSFLPARSWSGWPFASREIFPARRDTRRRDSMLSKTQIEKIGQSDAQRKVDYLLGEFRKIAGCSPVERVRWYKFIIDKDPICW